MNVELKKFDTLLLSRQAGRESFAAFQSTLAELKPNESLEIDFTGVLTLSPSWADEFFTPLLEQLDERLVLLPSDNLSVQTTLKLLQEVNKRNFRMTQ